MTWWLNIADLDEDQKDVIALPPQGDYMILGPPGSGKTNLLLLRAEYLIRTDQPNVFVLMFNDPLHEFVVRGGSHYAVPTIKIRKIMSWEMSLLREHGIEVTGLPDEDLPDRRRSLARKVLHLLDANQCLEKHIECLLVDEIQDCLREEVDVFFRCAKHVCFAGDNRQRIFSADSPIDEIRPKVKTVEITTHYRIAHIICRAADAVATAAGLPAIEDNCNYGAGEGRVEFLSCADAEEQAGQIIDRLQVQLTAYPGELLGVLAPRKADRDFLRAKIEASAVADYLLPNRESGSDDPRRRVYVAHLLEVKGLEFRAAHLGLMESLSRLGPNQKRIAYTAITRAKTSLSIYHSGTIPGYLEQARVAVQAPVPKPALEDLFPGKATPQ